MGVIEDAVEALLEERMRHFEWYLAEKYNLNSENIQSLPGYIPTYNETTDNAITSNNSQEMYEEKKKETAASPVTASEVSDTTTREESGLETEALDSVCPIGKFKGKTLRQVWASGQDGQTALKVFAKSQHGISASSAIVVAFYEEASQ